MTVRPRESDPGVYRLGHDSGNHDDRAFSMGLAALALTERAESDGGSFTNPREQYAARESVGPATRILGSEFMNPAYQTRRIRGDLASVYAAQRDQTEAQRRAGIGLPVAGSANDPSRVR